MRGISTTNKCGFQIDKFWCEYFQPDHPMPDDDERDSDHDERDSDHDERDLDEGPDEMFRFIKVMKP